MTKAKDLSKSKAVHEVYRKADQLPDVNITNRKGKLYHLTESKNVNSILYNGLKESDNLIWFFDNLDRITILTVCLVKNFDFKDFAIIEVDEQGCTGFVTNENFKGHPFKFIYIKQPLIKPEFLRLQGEYNISINRVKQSVL